MSRQLVQTVRSRLPGSASRLLHGTQDREGPPAFVFDIDGVLVKGQQILEPAKKALGLLYEGKGIMYALRSGSNLVSQKLSLLKYLYLGQDRPLYPTCFMTNGGGVTEAEKAEHLSEWLNISVHPDQVIV